MQLEVHPSHTNMGCSESRTLSRPEETSLLKAQEALGLGRHSVEFIDQIIRKYSSFQHVNDSHLQSIQDRLQVHLSNYDNQTLITAAMSTLRRSDGVMLKPLLILGIFAGEGNLNEKATLLYEVYDVECTQTLTPDLLNTMFSDLILVAVDCLGALSSELPVQNYLSVIQNGKYTFKEHLKTVLQLPSPCNKAQFINAWNKATPLELAPYSIRQAIFQEASKQSSVKLRKSGAMAIRGLKMANRAIAEAPLTEESKA